MLDSRPICAPLLLASTLLLGAPPQPQRPDLNAIVARWAAENEADFRAAADYSYRETVRTGHGSKTYDVTMLFGSPYKRLLSVDGHPLSEADRRHEDEKLAGERRKRAAESAGERASRIADYQKDRRRANAIIEEIPRAFQFQLRNTRRIQARTVYVLGAVPRRGYEPPSTESRVLTGMNGEFWIDTNTFQLVHGTARVIKQVSIAGFLATVEPGTEFIVEQQPVDGRIWLPSRFQIRSRSSILFLFHHHLSEDHLYFDYRKGAD